MKNNRISHFSSAKRVVVKVGSGVLTSDHSLNIDAIGSLSNQISTLSKKGFQIILVSSGAMAAGLKKVGLPARPEEIPKRQAVAAVGQAGLIMEYEKAFGKFQIKVAQVLLTRSDLCDRRRYLNARNTLQTLLSWGVIPIINENDTVMTEEIKFGDNDNLAAMITILMDADILISLTDIDGFFTKDPRKYNDADLIPFVPVVKKSLEKLAGGIAGPLGTGGMLSKIKAAKKVTAAGIPMVIARGEKEDILLRLFGGEELGTYFVPADDKLPSRKCWIAFTLKPKGSIIIDNGARDAVVSKGKSLLPIGIVDLIGEFAVGSCVEFLDMNQVRIGTGLVNYSSADIKKIMGLKSTEIKHNLGYKPYDEVIHRDNLTIIS